MSSGCLSDGDLKTQRSDDPCKALLQGHGKPEFEVCRRRGDVSGGMADVSGAAGEMGRVWVEAGNRS
jgi:hypothetical protein